MSREWFEIARPPLDRTRHHAFADPLEGEEWQRLRWVVPLLSWVSEGRTHVSPRGGQASRVASGRHAAKA